MGFSGVLEDRVDWGCGRVGELSFLCGLEGEVYIAVTNRALILFVLCSGDGDCCLLQ